MPCYKSKKYLRKAVKYILTQDYSNFEVIVTSDADPENSIQEIQNIKDHRLKVVELSKNVGRYAIDHSVVDSCKSDYFVPIDSDDWCNKSFLSTLIKITEKYKTLDVVFSAQKFSTGQTKSPKKWDRTDTFKHHAGQAALWRREFLLEMNLTNPNFRVGWDSIMTSVPWLFGNVGVNHTPLYNVVRREGSLTSSKETGFGTPYRRKVQRYLAQLWKDIVKNKDDREAIKCLLLQSRKEIIHEEVS